MWDIGFYILLAMVFTYIFKDGIPNVFKYYYNISVIIFFTIFNTLILMPIFIYNGKNVNNARLMAYMSRDVTKLLGIKWHLRNAEVVAQNKQAVIILNHQSFLDLLGLCNLWHAWHNVTPVVKKEIFYLWPFGLGLYLMNAIFVKRGSPEITHDMLQKKANNALTQDIKILIFPEGKENRDYTKLLPFKKGAFNIAVGAQVPIIPIVISRYYFINYKKRIFNGGDVIAQCMNPVSTEGLTEEDIPNLINRVQSDMEKTFKELSNELTSTLPPDYPLEKQD